MRPLDNQRHKIHPAEQEERLQILTTKGSTTETTTETTSQAASIRKTTAIEIVSVSETACL